MKVSPSVDLEAKRQYPTFFATLRDFAVAITDAVSRHDQGLLHHLADNFTVSDNGVVFVGSGSSDAHGGNDNQQRA